MNILQRILIDIAAVALAVVIAFACGHHTATTSCHQADTAAASVQAVKVATETGATKQIVKDEATDYEQAITHVINDAPIVRVCPAAEPAHPSAVLPAASPASVDHGAAGVPAKAQPDTQGVDIGKPVESVGLQADAQVTELQNYIRDICKPK